MAGLDLKADLQKIPDIHFNPNKHQNLDFIRDTLYEDFASRKGKNYD